MKLLFPAALALAALTALASVARADDTTPSTGTVLVPNNHGGYNTANPNARATAITVIPFFGSHGYAAHVAAHSEDTKPKFIIRPVVVDSGHGKVTVYKKIFFATPEEAAAAAQQPYTKPY
jgi:hypothetical protein